VDIGVVVEGPPGDGTVGGTAGAQLQIARVVVGIETDFDWAGVTGSSLLTPRIFGIPALFTVNASTRLYWDLTAVCPRTPRDCIYRKYAGKSASEKTITHGLGREMVNHHRRPPKCCSSVTSFY
jgi:hypothetical protein